ncbi:MAG: sigma-70 family RNA polymerase sigma factor [Bacteroidetes bacterium]|jgi:RNA polymerase sigma factor (sigma-70 family)|nr:MAG: sigma-70 family RNA polymerase sigma factor [Bacteroidota bacterium]UCE69083.1 MAG: sigma-70 family RNA polymerase sigma factor [Flavobacteriaceae bacterium]
MENTLHYDKKQAEYHRFVNDNYENLKRLRTEDKRAAFNELLLKVLPDIRRYITRGLRIALEKGVISHNKFKPDDLFDQLIIDVYDHLEEVHDKDEFHAWLFKRAEKLLDDMEVEEEFESYFYDNIDEYSRAELAEMKEAFSTDGDGDLVMMEELDDISYKSHRYLLKNIYLDDAHEDLMALMDADEQQARTQRHLDTVLFQLPPNMRSIFELATEQLFSIDDIARIKGVSIERIEKTLDRARELLRDSLKDRFYES